jgi:hypothetical protein
MAEWVAKEGQPGGTCQPCTLWGRDLRSLEEFWTLGGDSRPAPRSQRCGWSQGTLLSTPASVPVTQGA